MSLEDDLMETANIEVMQRVLEPVDDDIPDPGIDFDGCVNAIMKRTKRKVIMLSLAKRGAYFLDKARSSREWCRRTNAPTELTERVEQWLERLERQWPS